MLSPGSKLNRKEIKGKCLLNNVPLDNTLKRVMSSDLIQKKGNYYFINPHFLNLENERDDEINGRYLLEILKEQFVLLKSLPFDVYIQIVDLIYEISKLREIDVFIFGSYSKLVYKKNSDIDIAIIHGKNEIDKRSISRFAQKLEKKYKKEIELHFFVKNKFYNNKKDPLVKDIIKNGIKLV
jgi:predicted nucleotidyltransferase